MRVRLLVSMAGPGGAWSPGDEAELPDAEALRLIAAGYAEAAAGAPEQAVRQPARTAVSRAGARKRGD